MCDLDRMQIVAVADVPNVDEGGQRWMAAHTSPIRTSPPGNGKWWWRRCPRSLRRHRGPELRILLAERAVSASRPDLDASVVSGLRCRICGNGLQSPMLLKPHGQASVSLGVPGSKIRTFNARAAPEHLAQ